jgi:transposase-like protein
MTCIRCIHGTAKKHRRFGKSRVQRWRCTSCNATFAEPRPKIGTHYLRMEKASQVISMMLVRDEHPGNR